MTRAEDAEALEKAVSGRLIVQINSWPLGAPDGGGLGLNGHMDFGQRAFDRVTSTDQGWFARVRFMTSRGSPMHLLRCIIVHCLGGQRDSSPMVSRVYTFNAMHQTRPRSSWLTAQQAWCLIGQCYLFTQEITLAIGNRGPKSIS